MANANDFDSAARQQRANLSTARPGEDFLIRCAVLAASSHNTQPWTFRSETGSITIRPDTERRCSVVDPEDAHLYRSLGCAAENLVQAASTQGLAATVRFDPDDDAVTIDLTASDRTAPMEVLDAITARQCTRLAFDGTPVHPDHLAELEHAGTGDGVRTILLTDRAMLTSIVELVTEGNQIQLTDQAFRHELLTWIRFNPDAAVRTGDGLAGHCSNNPSLPTWLGRLLAPVAITARSQSRRDRTNILSSAGVAVFVADHDDKAAWVETGRAYERFALRATALDIRTAFINQPIDVASLRPRFEELLGLHGEHAQLAVRFDHGALAPYSLRRPLDAVLDRSPQVGARSVDSEHARHR